MCTRRGSLIVFEGCDKSGKTSICNILKSNVSYHNVKFFHFPDRTTQTGILIDSYLSRKYFANYKSLHLLFAANKWEKYQTIMNHLERGFNVIIDRYIYSGIVYALANNCELTWCKNINSGLPIPDLTIYLKSSFDQIPPKDDFGRELFEIASFQKRVSLQYTLMADPTWTIIDTKNSSIEELVNIILPIINVEFQRKKREIKFYQVK